MSDDGVLTMELIQSAIDKLMDDYTDCCELCGAPRRRSMFVGYSDHLFPVPIYRLVGGCEHE